MAARVQLGLTFVPWNHPPEQLPVFARTAEDAGMDQLWLWEDCFSLGGMSTAAVALASTEALQVGLALMPAPLRNVGLAAMEIASLGRTYPGRLLPGVGHGVQRWMAQAGAKVTSPMTLLQEYFDALQRLLEGEEVTTDGRYVGLNAVKLSYPPTDKIPLLTGGFGPKTLQFAAERADGVLLAEGGAQAVTDMMARLAGVGRSPMVVVGIGGNGDQAADQVLAEVSEVVASGATHVAVAPPVEVDLVDFTSQLRAAVPRPTN